MMDTIQDAYIRVISESMNELDDFVSKTKQDHPEIRNLVMYPYGNDIKLDTLAIHKDKQGLGVGTKILDKIKQFSDTHNKRIMLTTGTCDPNFGTTSQSRLDKFYRKNGFISDKGRNKDFSITTTHYYVLK